MNGLNLGKSKPMIISTATGKNKTSGKPQQILIIGLTYQNIMRMIHDQPVHIRKEVHGPGVPEGWEIVIFAGESEANIYEMFKKGGVFGQETTIIVDPETGIKPQG